MLSIYGKMICCSELDEHPHGQDADTCLCLCRSTEGGFDTAKRAKSAELNSAAVFTWS